MDNGSSTVGCSASDDDRDGTLRYLLYVKIVRASIVMMRDWLRLTRTMTAIGCGHVITFERRCRRRMALRSKTLEIII